MRVSVEVPVQTVEHRGVVALVPRDTLRRFMTLDAVREWVDETASLPADTIVRIVGCIGPGIFEVDVPTVDVA